MVPTPNADPPSQEAKGGDGVSVPTASGRVWAVQQSFSPGSAKQQQPQPPFTGIILSLYRLDERAYGLKLKPDI